MGLTDFTTLSFDCYGTLIDWEAGIRGALGKWAHAHGIDSTTESLLSAFARYESRFQQEQPDRPYPDVLRAVHGAIAAEFSAAASFAERSAFAASIADWPLFADTKAALQRLKNHYRLVVLSNIDQAAFDLANQQLAVTFDAVFTAEAIGSYKPDPRNFRYMLDRLAKQGTQRGDILHCAQSLYHDIVPAQRVGLATAWINRRHGQAGCGATPPARAQADFEFPSLSALVAAMGIPDRD